MVSHRGVTDSVAALFESGQCELPGLRRNALLLEGTIARGNNHAGAGV
jgi:hypothetical protein